MSEYEPVKPHTDRHGYVWKPYSVQFKSPEGLFVIELWGVSWEHAELQLQALKETGKVTGERQGSISADGDFKLPKDGNFIRSDDGSD